MPVNSYDYNQASPDRYMLLKAFAKENRKHPTDAELLLWENIRDRQLGYKFNRQHIINDYIVDFVCLQCYLVIEVDGGYHAEREQLEYDEHRTEILEGMGFEVIRFSNEEIFNELDSVIEKIENILENNNE